ncbi:MAG: aspartate--tRNA ligase [Candidatus Yanofskybacteria bacterium RIFCSPHIGHO2_01_FULL_39_8b]|uniref:Aspartate--tRNA(Asp/Asn) ligase n=1 Tax=Candidatus Yanofskybacteria bacterium RIFCSPHIGHO2_01_FULL_39_8b TaxID=1802659 RepID=A0A1F8E902_9BACT|nr:MAG: aspartate--tRNA ligase [Candidatus Yanofskybacteria bacterium RIFCSPHIGHO2_01_FULL_39_8b]
MFRTHTCGELTKKQEGKSVTLSGWVNSRRDHGGVIFIDVRDRYGMTQVTFDPKHSETAWKTADRVRDEFVIKITGKVILRTEDMINPRLKTGEIEITAQDVEILNSSKTPPFQVSYIPGEEAGDAQVDQSKNVNEDLRLKYRFLDIRRRRMLENLEFRHKVIFFMRTWMTENNFIEVETPILTASSPEGARDFLVPSRLHPGKFYALPQAPQQYKQLLMVGGIDRYFQIAPCMRDEDARADRSPGEFYQLDVETSFMTQDEFFTLMEPLFHELAKKFSNKEVMFKKFPRIPYKESMLKYGSDKPDLRIPMEIQDITDIVKGCGFAVFAKVVEQKGVVRALKVPGGAKLSRTEIEKMTEEVKSLGAKGLAYIIVEEQGKHRSPIVKFLGDDLVETIIKEVKAKKGDVIFFGADKPKIVEASLGATRINIAKKLGIVDTTKLAFCWIVDFPMYEFNEEERKIDFMHNPFSMPQGAMKDLEEKDPLDILAYQYDIVCNGIELSSGAVRNNVPEIMYKAFEIGGYKKEEVDAKFGAMIDAFKFGAPPHCGFAPGIERTIMILRDESNIREITAFPKNGRAEDVMMGAPREVSARQLKESHIKLDVLK